MCAVLGGDRMCAPARGKDMGSHPLCGGGGGGNSCKLGVHATCGPLGPGQNRGRLPHEIAVAEDVLDDKRCLTASWYESVAHTWSSGSCCPLQYTCRSSRSLSNMSSQLAVSEQSNSLNRSRLHMYSLWGLNPRPMAHKTIALTTELRELLKTPSYKNLFVFKRNPWSVPPKQKKVQN